MTVAVFSKTLKGWAVGSSSHPNLRTSSPATASSMSWGKHDSNHPAGPVPEPGPDARCRGSSGRRLLRWCPGPPSYLGMTDPGPVFFDQAGHVTGSNALDPGPHLPVLEQLPPLAFFYVSESNPSRRNSLLERPYCFIASSTRSAISGGNEKVMVLVVLGVIASLLSSLTRMPAHHRSPVNQSPLKA